MVYRTVWKASGRFSIRLIPRATIETTDSTSIVVVDDIEEKEERVEGIGKIQHTIDSTICNTNCTFDDASFLTDKLAMIETTPSGRSSIHTIDSTICITNCSFDDASFLTHELVIIETTL
jgi:hypothetical protein